MYTKKSMLKLAFASLIMFWSALTIAAGSEPSKYTAFEIPGAKFISPQSISENGWITGFSKKIGDIDDEPARGFVRTQDGVITSFEVSGKIITAPLSINSDGVITGIALERAELPSHGIGFVRKPDGVITTFDISDATFTSAVSINESGLIAGFYKTKTGDSSLGFVRTADGAMTTFAVSGAVATKSISINNVGMITGCFGDTSKYDASPFPTCGDKSHGFARMPDGRIEKFDVPGAASTEAAAINDDGIITGVYTDDHSRIHGFERTLNGAITTFDFPKATKRYANVKSITNTKVIAGTLETNDGMKGFVRDLSSVITVFNYPGAKNTWVSGINGKGTVLGSYSNIDDGYSPYGFVLHG